MKKPFFAVILFLLLAAAFIAGNWYNQRSAAKVTSASGRRILYYYDPMHPAYKSDKPGIAPDCGMELEPVYADGGSADPPGKSSSMSAGTVNISPEKQQTIGVQVSTVEKAASTHTLRIFGRVVPDEARIYKLNAGIEGFIQEVSDVTTGSLVKKDQLLATFSAPNASSAIQTYILNVGAQDRFRKSAEEGSPDGQSLPSANWNVQLRVQQLQAVGMSLLQMEEIKRTRQVPESIKIYAPAEGFVLARNVSPGQKFEKGAEWYRIADLKRVWILADVFGREAKMIRPGMTARVSLADQDLVLQARVSEVLPEFDPVTRTLKVRLEADNPGYALRPDMFVDVELPVILPSAITVPVDAVLDSGRNKTIFVDLGEGFFEPRKVETGWRMGDRVEINEGLKPGERIVVSGTFLIDSESRMKAAAAGIYGASSKDPVCGMEVDEGKATAAGHRREYRGKIYYFCSDQCQRDFDKSPGSYASKPAGGEPPQARPTVVQKAETKSAVATDLSCGMEVNISDAKAAGLTSEYRGKSYYFCSPKCKQQFDKEPQRYVGKTAGSLSAPSTSEGGGQAHD
jgi:membrane fusion protein, copper/silver efflux system